MSLPMPSISGAPVDPQQLQALDAPLIALTQQCGGDLRRVMFSFFSFLHRRTDFYLVPHPDDNNSKMGFREGDAEKLLLAAFRQFPLRRIPSNKDQQRSSRTTTSTEPSFPPEQSDSRPSSIPGNQSPAMAPSEIRATPGMERSPSKATEEPPTDSDVRYTEDGLQVPVGNGGSTKAYKWTQTIDECSVLVGVPKSLRGKDLVVKITPSTLLVKAGKPLDGETEARIFAEGTLFDKVRADESSWSIEGGVVIVILEKLKNTFWKSVLEGDEEIDTELVDNRRRIDEYDDATQAKIRRILFDQEQYHKGGPTSDEILGQKASIPPLPPGVEYIDRKKLDEEDRKAKQQG